MTEAPSKRYGPADPRASADSQAVLRIGIFGAPLDTSNLGVSALGISTLCGLARARPNLDLTLFDYGEGERPLELPGPRGSFSVRQVGCADSRRVWRRGNLRSMWWSARLGFGRLHPMVRRLGALHALLDISGGDSFTDLYGAWRFGAVTLPKRLALELGVPLVLLPQTYGPYASPRRAELARALVLGARQAWARDERSLDVLRELLGARFEPTRHRGGIDVAFGLPVAAPARPDVVSELRARRAAAPLLLGLNVSGLLFNEAAASARFGLRLDYRALMRDLLARLLEVERAQVVLVPHVVSPQSDESDVTACNELARSLAPADAARVWLAPAFEDPREVKWLIGQLDWLCATRMHACIAALSQGIPTFGLAYSDKALGVFESVGAGDALLDPRRLDAAAIVARARESIAGRAAAARALQARLAGLEQAVAGQFRAIVEAIA